MKAKAAFVGSAFGDALGWPHEGRASRTDTANERAGTAALQDWYKRSGGMYARYEEQIEAGEYSDDTQLILSTTRSLLGYQRWWLDFAFTELPAWSVYERGAGGATKRAIELLLSGSPPWESKNVDSCLRYFSAGGNGAAMRILPHAIKRATDKSFQALAAEILANSVCTHGHPRALLGALVMGYAQWTVLRHEGTLKYGELISTLISDVEAWSRLPEISTYWPTWHRAAAGIVKDFPQQWFHVTEELFRQLSICRAAMEKGAIAVDRQTLSSIGCFDKATGAAGTTSACAAIFLASRYASSPLEGISVAATAKGADTDTIASMAGGLLGAIGGIDWLLPFDEELQDFHYIAELSESLVQFISPTVDCRRPLRRSDIKKFENAICSGTSNDQIKLPDGRSAYFLKPLPSKAYGRVSARIWKAKTSDGQTVVLRCIRRTQREQVREEPVSPQSKNEEHTRRLDQPRVGVMLSVSRLSDAIQFYAELLGLRMTRQNERFAIFGGSFGLQLANRPRPYEDTSRESLTIVVEVDNAEICFARLRKAGVKSVSDIQYRAGRAFLTCKDPDGYSVEIFESDTQDTAPARLL